MNLQSSVSMNDGLCSDSDKAVLQCDQDSSIKIAFVSKMMAMPADRSSDSAGSGDGMDGYEFVGFCHVKP